MSDLAFQLSPMPPRTCIAQRLAGAVTLAQAKGLDVTGVVLVFADDSPAEKVRSYLKAAKRRPRGPRLKARYPSKGAK